MDVPWRTLTLMLRYSSTAVVLVGPDGQVRWASRGARRLFAGIPLRGATLAELFDDPVAADLFLQASARNEPGYSTGWRTVHRHPDGWVGEVFVEATLLPASQATGILVSIYAPPPEIVEIDALTGCGNRRRMEWALAGLNGVGCLASLDLNRFKQINDEHGHAVGDKVLVTVADRLRRTVIDQGAVFRMGGDEFAIVFSSPDLAHVEDLLGQALREVGKPIEIEPGLEVVCSASAGLTSLDSRSSIMLLREVDQAFYYAKRHGRPCVVAGRDMPEWARDRVTLLATAESLEVERDTQAKLARTDPLTGLANRLSLDEDSRRLAARADRSGEPFSVLFVDLDYFSEYNKRHGDSAGDKALIAVGEVMRSQCRTADVVYRKGGEEFVLLLPDTTLGEAAAIAERLRAAIADAALPHLGRGDDLKVLTVVVGVAQSSPDDPSPEHTWERASAPIMSLKKDKNAPRNRVLAADPTPGG